MWDLDTIDWDPDTTAAQIVPVGPTDRLSNIPGNPSTKTSDVPALSPPSQVRWIEAEESPDEARLGIEFVLLTEPDRRRIAGTLARAALALREQERKAA